jgi:hypothetical protein
VALSVNDLRIERSLPHGHIAAVLGMAKKLDLHRLLPKSPARLTKLALAKRHLRDGCLVLYYSPRQVRTPFAANSQANFRRKSCTRFNELLVRLFRRKS